MVLLDQPGSLWCPGGHEAASEFTGGEKPNQTKTSQAYNLHECGLRG